MSKTPPQLTDASRTLRFPPAAIRAAHALSFALVPAALAVGAIGCASKEPKSEAASTAARGDQEEFVQKEVVASQRSIPENIQVDSFMHQRTAHQFLAEVRTPDPGRSHVRLRVEGSPVEIEMQNVGGNLWRGTLSPEQLGQLASGGKIVNYEARIYVEEPSGQVLAAQDPLKFSVTAPPIEERFG